MTVLSFHRNTAPAAGIDCPTGRQAMADPQSAPADFVLSVRALPMTDAVLQSLVLSEGFTFWGQAIDKILEFVFDHPDLAPVYQRELSECSKMIFTTGGARGNRYYSGDHIDAARPSRGVLAALSPETMGKLCKLSQVTRVPKERLAASILHRHARPVVAMIQAAKH